MNEINKEVESLRIIQWNARNMSHKHSMLSIHQNLADIFVISETHLSKGDDFYLQGFDIIRKDRDIRQGGGVAILIKHGILYEENGKIQDCNSKLELRAVDILLSSGKKITIVSVYRPPNSELITKEEWTNYFRQFGSDFAVLGDFNAHHHEWGDSEDDDHGVSLVEGMDAFGNAALLNEEESTFIHSAYGTATSIDLAIVNASSALQYNWRVNDDLWGSDHYPIFVSFNVSPKNKLLHPKNKLATICN